MDRSFEQEFQALFPERKSAFTNHFNDASVRGRRVLVTGAGGSIGSALATTILGCSPKRLILLDHSIHSLQELQIAMQSGHRFAAVQLVLADLRDNRFVIDLLKNEQPEIVFHAAAFKHVPLLEENPFTAIENNALATWRLAQNAAKYGVHQTFLISTDKAANPRSMLGISKRLAELAILRWNHTGSRMTALRMGNVAGSSGSVLPKFREQIQQGGPVTVTHPRATRYFLTMKETCCAIGALANLGDRSGVFVPEMGDPISILDLATRMVRAARVAGPANVAARTIRVARSRMEIGSPISGTKTPDLSPRFASALIAQQVSFMVKKYLVARGCVTVTGPPCWICSRNFGKTLPLEPATFPIRKAVIREPV